MTARYRSIIAMPMLAAGLALLTAEAGAGNCSLNKNAGQLMMVERNVDSLDKRLTGPDKAAVIAGLRSRVASLKKRGDAFPGKATPLEKECEDFVKEGKKLEAMKQERDKKLAGINDKIKQNKTEHDRVIAPHRQALDNELAGLKSQGCFLGQKDNDLYKQCHGQEVSWQGRSDALKSDAKRYLTKHDQLVAQKKEISRPYDERLKKVQASYQAFVQRWKGYNAERKRWDADLKQVWGETTQLFMQAQKLRQTPAKPRGGEIGKLSGPMDKGSSGRSPGSGKLPAGVKADGEGGARGQARAASAMGKQGVAAGSDSEAAFKAGRVFDRGDVKVAGDASVVDARGVERREVPEEVRQNPRWQTLDRKEQAYEAEQKKVQRKIDAIKQKLQAGEGDKGKLQVELVHARDEQDKIQSKVNVIKVEKQSFQLSIEEKPQKKSNSGK